MFVFCSAGIFVFNSELYKRNQKPKDHLAIGMTIRKDQEKLQQCSLPHKRHQVSTFQTLRRHVIAFSVPIFGCPRKSLVAIRIYFEKPAIAATFVVHTWKTVASLVICNTSWNSWNLPPRLRRRRSVGFRTQMSGDQHAQRRTVDLLNAFPVQDNFLFSLRKLSRLITQSKTLFFAFSNFSDKDVH